jgi:PAS domain S-box-containing protein
MDSLLDARIALSDAAAVAALLNGEVDFRAYFDISPDCMFQLRVEQDGRFVYAAVNKTAARASGLSSEMLIGRTPEEVLGPDKGQMMTEGLRTACATGKPFRYEPTWTLPDGEVTYDAVYIPQLDPDGRIIGILGIARNITKERLLEKSLFEARKMQALGLLSGGIAHDFNNVLGNVQACLRLLGKLMKTGDAELLVKEGFRAVERGQALTKRMLAFARQQPLETDTCELNDLIEAISPLVARTLDGNIQLIKNFEPDLWPARCNKDEFQIAVVNLAINARDAMPRGGVLTLETRNERIGTHHPTGLAAGDYAVFSVADTGTGMPPEVLARVLEPFFTTKPEGMGTGLGLSMLNEMVKSTGGGLAIESEPDKGTRISIYFPRSDS